MFPARSVTLVVTVAVIVSPVNMNGKSGTIWAVVPSRLRNTFAGTKPGVRALVRLIVVGLIVRGSIGSSKVTDMVGFVLGTFVPPGAGTVETTVGGMVSKSVEKVSVKFDSRWFPAWSVTPVVMVAM